MANSQIQQNLIPNEPQLSDLLGLLKKDIMLSLAAHHIGTVQSFDASNQTATATINYKKTYFQLDPVSGDYVPVLVDYPILIDCPVICLGGGLGALTFPIKAGDECVVLFNDRDLDTWFQGGSGGAVATPRLHSFSDAMILVGVRSLAKVLTDYDEERSSLKYGTTRVAVGETLVLIENEQFQLGTLIQELLSELQDLTNQLSVLTVTGVTSGGSPSGPPANAAQITLIGTQIGQTATKIGELLE